MQAHMRGWLARNRKFVSKVSTHLAAVEVIDGMVTNYLEDRMIPNLLIELFRKNNLYENIGLYSSENQAYY